MKQYLTYFVDDNIRFLENITKNKPASIFDDPYLKFHKELHDKYNLKVQFNLFYQNFDRTWDLSMMTDAYKEEFLANKDWMRFGFHARHELPDWPYLNATYDEVMKDYTDIEKEIIRFAGKETLTRSAIAHWVTMTKEGMMALKDKGIEMLSCTMGDEVNFPEARSTFSTEHNFKLDENKTRPVSKAFVCQRKGGGFTFGNFNHLDNEGVDKYLGKLQMYVEPETGIALNRFACILLNATKLSAFDPILENLKKYEHTCLAMHEQYFYDDYFAYEPDFAEKVEYAWKAMIDAGFEPILMDELVDLQNK